MTTAIKTTFTTETCLGFISAIELPAAVIASDPVGRAARFYAEWMDGAGDPVRVGYSDNRNPSDLARILDVAAARLRSAGFKVRAMNAGTAWAFLKVVAGKSV